MLTTMSCDTSDTICEVFIHVYVLCDTSFALCDVFDVYKMLSLLHVYVTLIANRIPVGSKDYYYYIVQYTDLRTAHCS